MKVTSIENMRVWKKGGTAAFFSVEFDAVFTSKNWRLFHGQNGQAFEVGLPSEMDKTGKKDENGNPKWWPTIWIDFKTDEGRKLMDQIRDAAVAKYEKESGGGRINEDKAPRAEDFSDDDIPF